MLIAKPRFIIDFSSARHAETSFRNSKSVWKLPQTDLPNRFNQVPSSLYLCMPPCACASLLNTSLLNTQAVGKFLLSPASAVTNSGHYSASISIRSGQGSGTHDRVFSFVPEFPSPQAALKYALEQGLGFLRLPGLPA